jgi:hypothetical protein
MGFGLRTGFVTTLTMRDARRRVQSEAAVITPDNSGDNRNGETNANSESRDRRNW